MKCTVLLLLVLGAGRMVLAQPTLAYPVSGQYPPVARLQEAYSFVLSANTFTTTAGHNLTYSASNLPQWLAFDDQTLEFSGTPTSSSDIGFPTFTLAANDSTDNTNASETVSIPVTNTTAPSVAISCSEQLRANYTSYTGAGIALTPGTRFSLVFANNMFAGNVSAVYGLFSGRTPLPSWISFNSGSMRFEGNAPALPSSIAPPLVFEFLLVGTDIPGYSAAESSFNIIVGHHSLQAQSVVVNATEGESFEQPLNVTLDGTHILSSNISSVSVNGTQAWMNFDNSTLTLSGTPQNETIVGEDTQVTVTITDVYGDEIDVSIDVIVMSSNTSSSVFGISGLKNVTAERGQDFNDTLSLSSTSDISNVSVTYVPSSASSWLSFDETALRFSGQVPNNLDTVEVIVTVTTKSGTKQTAQFYIIGEGTVASTTSAPASSATSSPSATASISLSMSSTTTSSPTASASSTRSQSNSTTSSKTVAIVCGTVIPIAVILAAGIVWYCCCLGGVSGRRHSQSSSATQVSPTSGHNISKPILIEDDWPLPPPSRPGRAWSPPRRLSGMSVFSSHRRSYSDLEKQPHIADNGFAIPQDPDNPSRPRRSRLFASRSSLRDSLASLATVATNEIFSVRLVESSHGDIAGLAGRRHSRHRNASHSGGSGSGSSSTIGPYSTSSGDSPQRLRSVREEDIGDDMVGLVSPPTVHQEEDSDDLDQEYNSSASEQSSQHFEIVPGAERQWHRTSNTDGAGEEPQLVEFTSSVGLASRRGEGSSVSSDDGQVFL
ncbi:hypothetical protein V1525DRAFT_397709 [Lipomyces kononenkoae]|uniref:Uncharacterized protein n=1 Tax=Lipomyces kononenkoae TaxID=34357 RepID=A0ACC3T6H5_LIPKO